MKKRILSIVAAVVCVLMLTFVQQNAQAANTTSLTGNKTVRAGETLTLSFNMSGSGIVGIRADIEYDSALLTLKKVENAVKGNWIVSLQENRVLAYDDDQKNPINGNTSVLTLIFEVNKNAGTGEALTVKIVNISASAGVDDIYLSDAAFSTTVVAPKSSNANISEISISNAELVESFNPSVADYNVKAPFSVTSLDMLITTADANATYAIEGNNDFVVGKNTVRIIVTAENGTKKTYTLNVEREQDPNYVPSSNALLSQILLSTGTVSPKFLPNVRNYVVYVPYETMGIEVSGKPGDKNATVNTMEYALKSGNNVIKLVCVAEDGVTKAEYVINVYRMPKYEGKLPNISMNEPDPIPTPTPTPTDTSTPTVTPTPTPSGGQHVEPSPSASQVQPSTSPSITPGNNDDKSGIIRTVVIIFVVIALLVIAAAVAFYVYVSMQRSKHKNR